MSYHRLVIHGSFHSFRNLLSMSRPIEIGTKTINELVITDNTKYGLIVHLTTFKKESVFSHSGLNLDL